MQGSVHTVPMNSADLEGSFASGPLAGRGGAVSCFLYAQGF